MTEKEMPGNLALRGRDVVYPEEIRELEEELVRTSRGARLPGGEGRDGPEPLIGVALSGGGIRSATFALGIFQALARGDWLRRVDFLSTVSGGGYFGSFFTRLFSRDGARKLTQSDSPPEGSSDGTPDWGTESFEDVPAVLLEQWKPEILRHLREHGRYLSPNGSGDLLLGGAVLFRNWVSLHVVLQTFLLLLFMAAHLLVQAVLRPGTTLAEGVETVMVDLPAGQLVSWSPWLLVAAAVFAFLVVPVGWAYWLVEPWRWTHPFWLPLLLLAAGVVGGLMGWLPGPAAWPMIVIGALTLIFWGLGWRWWSRHEEAHSELSQRNRFSQRLTEVLLWTGGLAALGVFDSVGQTLYLAASDDSVLTAWELAAGSAGVGALLAAAGMARRIAVRFADSGRGRPRVSLKVLASVAAFVLVVADLTLVSLGSHALAWGFQPPEGVELAQVNRETPRSTVHELPAGGASLDLVGPEGEESRTPGSWQPAGSDPEHVLRVTLGLLVACLLLGRSWTFLNRSSHHPLYSARLTRAYLGASNSKRWSGEVRLNQSAPGDDVIPGEYWRHGGNTAADGPSPFEKGAPLHLVNVTVNETVDGRSQVQQQDRKGLGMAIGPAGISLGRRRHLYVQDWASTQVKALEPSGGHQIFDGPGQLPEPLTIGKWVAISGAAFSTGTGYRTSLGLSLLTGLANVRLGYWWKALAGFQSSGSLVRKGLNRVFPVQTYLFAELLSRFPGTARDRWYLSDGGHFENLATYELVRRRVERILLVDAEADPDYVFTGLGNLVRRVRIDFGAEIEFLTREELDELGRSLEQETGTNPLGCVTTLDDLRRRGNGRTSGNVDACSSPQAPDARAGLSLGHAALARIRYEADASPEEGWLLYVKPTLVGHEPTDLIEYHRAHEDFPHETTADQFFDEAQWESYRKLGEWVGGQVVGEWFTGRLSVPELAEPES